MQWTTMVANQYHKHMSYHIAKVSGQGREAAAVLLGQSAVVDSELQAEVFVFGSQDTMNSVVVDVPASTDDDHTGALPALSLQPPALPALSLPPPAQTGALPALSLPPPAQTGALPALSLQPPAQTGALPALSLLPSPPSGPVSVVITTPTPPVSGSSGSSETPTLNGAIPGTDLSPGSSPSLTPPGALPPTPPSPAPHDTLSPGGRRRVPRGQRHKTITGVTEDARRVLDQFLKRSLSHNDAASPTQPHFPEDLPDMDVIREHDAPAAARDHDHDDDARFQPISLEPGVDDDGTSHSPVSGPNSLYSCSSRSSSYRNRIHLVKPLPPADADRQLRKAAGCDGHKQKKSKSHRLARRKSSSSSSSSEYEIVDGQLKLRRKKSLLKRLRASFRKKKTASRQSDFDPYNIDDEEIRDAEAAGQPKNRMHSKSLRASLGRRRQGADKSQWHSDVERRSPVGEGSVVPDGPAPHLRPPPHPRRPENGAVPGVAPDDPERHGKSAWRWVKEHLGRQKESTGPEKLKANRGIFERLLGQIRKGKGKLRRKSSGKERTVPQRASSTDAITYFSTTTTTTTTTQDSHVTENGVRSRHGRSQRAVAAAGGDAHWSEQRPAATTHWRTPPGGAGPGAVCVDGPDSPPSYPAPPPPMFPQCSPRARRDPLELRGLARCLPSSPGGASCCEVDLRCVEHVVTVSEQDGSTRRHHISQQELETILLQTTALDETDGGSPRLRRPAWSGQPDADVNKPFAQKTDQEKDEIYEKIAEQLASIADNYNLESPRSLKSAGVFFRASPELAAAEAAVRKSQSVTGVGVTGGVREGRGRPTLTVPVPGAAYGTDEGGWRASGDHTPIEQKLGKLLRDKGDKAASDLADLGPVVKELVKNASYSKFQQVIHENVGSEPGWQQVALVFNLTRSAVQLAGLGTAAALQIKELTLRYFEDRFAGWIVGQGGWESVVEDSDLSSEVD